jgi:hypothetical protein
VALQLTNDIIDRLRKKSYRRGLFLDVRRLDLDRTGFALFADARDSDRRANPWPIALGVVELVLLQLLVASRGLHRFLPGIKQRGMLGATVAGVCPTFADLSHSGLRVKRINALL